MELFANKNNAGNNASQANAQNINANTANQAAVGGISGLLNSGKAKPEDNSNAMNELQKEVSMMTRKIRINEERSLNIRKKSQMIEHNIISNHKKVLTEMRYMNEEIADLKKEIVGIKSKIATFAHELNGSAKKEDVQVLERYVNIWEPVNFVTRKETERIITDILEEKGILKRD